MTLPPPSEAGRRVSLCRELTKLHEEIIRTTLEEAAALYEAQPPRGEYVLVVEGAPGPSTQELTLEEALSLVRMRMEAGCSKKDAVRQISAETGFPKNLLYEAVLRL